MKNILTESFLKHLSLQFPPLQLHSSSLQQFNFQFNQNFIFYFRFILQMNKKFIRNQAKGIDFSFYFKISIFT